MSFTTGKVSTTPLNLSSTPASPQLQPLTSIPPSSGPPPVNMASSATTGVPLIANKPPSSFLPTTSGAGHRQELSSDSHSRPEETFFDPEAIRVIAQSLPSMPEISDAAAAALASDAEYRLREIVQDSMKFMKHSKRGTLTTNDVNSALRLRNIEPLYGFGPPARPVHQQNKNPLFTQATGAPDLFFVSSPSCNLAATLHAPLPDIPLEVTVSAHWLAIDGKQPTIAQNPPKDRPPSPPPGEQTQLIDAKAGNDNVKAIYKPLVRHDLSRELQLYFEHITETITESHGPHVDECLASVASEPGVVELLPYLSRFIRRTVDTSVHNLPLLFSIMRLVSSILQNPVFNLENYLHQLLPAILTCIVGKRLCSSPRENHWVLRDYTAKLLRRICVRYRDSYTTMQPRITKTLVSALSDVKRPLTTHYGAIVGLAALGRQVVDAYIINTLPNYTKKIRAVLRDTNVKPIRRTEASKVLGALAWAICAADQQFDIFEKQRDYKGSPRSVEQTEVTDFSYKKFTDMNAGTETLLQAISQEMGSKMYPFGDSTDETKQAEKLFTNRKTNSTRQKRARESTGEAIDTGATKRKA